MRRLRQTITMFLLAWSLSACAMFDIMAPDAPLATDIAVAQPAEPEPVEGLAIQWPGGHDERLNFLVTSLHIRANDHDQLADLGDLSLHPDGVELLLGTSGHVRTVAVDELHDPAAWDLDAPEGYAGFVGPFSALRSLAGVNQLTVTTGETNFCANPPRPAPDHLGDLTRVSIQPAAVESCIDWFTLELYLDQDGLVVAILVDLFGP